jgi:hypothetical protein
MYQYSLDIGGYVFSSGYSVCTPQGCLGAEGRASAILWS